MADLRITELPPISGGAVQPDKDFLALADTSASETKKVTPEAIVESALSQPEVNGGVPDGIIDPDKIDWDGLNPNTINGNAIDESSLNGSKLIDETVAGQKLIDGSVNAGTKLTDGTITEPKYGTGSVSTRAIADDSVTADKLAPGAAAGNIEAESLDGSVITDGSISNAKLQPINGALIIDETITGDKLVANSVTASKIADDAIEARHFSDSAVDPNGGLTVNGDGLSIENVIPSGTHAGINYDEHGLITGVAADGLVPRVDLPIATDTEIGVVSIPADGGLKVSGTGAVRHQNEIVATSFAGIDFDGHGHITGTDASGQIPHASVPIAGRDPVEIGGIYVSTDDDELSIAADGQLTHNVITGAAGTYTKVTVSDTGHVVSGENLTQPDIPGLDASIIVSGQFGTNRIEDHSITSKKLHDYATCLMQEDFPGAGDFLGQFWYTPSTAQLRVYSRGSGPENIWLPVGFGLLQQQNLRFAFTFDADTALITSITQYGAPLNLKVGDPIPAPTDTLSGAYGVCVVEGGNLTVHDVNGVNFTIGDWVLCAGETTGWLHIDIADGSGSGGGGAQVLNDLLDVTIGGPNPVGSEVGPAVALQDGDILRYYSSIGQWVNAPERAGVETGENPPTTAPPGTMWWDPNSGRLFISYDDGDTVQWVPATPETGSGGGSGGGGGGGADQLNDLNDVQAAKVNSAVLIYDDLSNRWESTTTIDSVAFTIDGGTY